MFAGRAADSRAHEYCSSTRPLDPPDSVPVSEALYTYTFHIVSRAIPEYKYGSHGFYGPPYVTVFVYAKNVTSMNIFDVVSG